MAQPIYLDNQATTRCDPRVVEAMLPYFSEEYGNASSVSHSYGQKALKAVNEAQEYVAELIGADDPKSIFFTSGATESNNIAIKGVLFGLNNPGHLVTTAAEHKAILDPASFVGLKGHEVTVVNVDAHAQVAPVDIETSIKSNTRLVSVIYANNEVGSINEIEEIARRCKLTGALFHTDATQAVGRLPINCTTAGIDMLSLSGHKLYGPKGIGALYIRKRSRGIKIEPLQHGGGHQNKIRSGTLPVALIVGLGEACRIAKAELESDRKKCKSITNNLLQSLRQEIPDIKLNGHPENRVCTNLHLTIPGVNSEALIHLLKDKVAISTGAACTTAAPEPSHVLLAMGRSKEEISSSIRFGVGRFTSKPEIDLAVTSIAEASKKLGRLAI